MVKDIRESCFYKRGWVSLKFELEYGSGGNLIIAKLLCSNLYQLSKELIDGMSVIMHYSYDNFYDIMCVAPRATTL